MLSPRKRSLYVRPNLYRPRLINSYLFIEIIRIKNIFHMLSWLSLHNRPHSNTKLVEYEADKNKTEGDSA